MIMRYSHCHITLKIAHIMSFEITTIEIRTEIQPMMYTLNYEVIYTMIHKMPYNIKRAKTLNTNCNDTHIHIMSHTMTPIACEPFGVLKSASNE